MSVIEKKSIYTKLSYTLGDINFLLICITVTFFLGFLMFKNSNLILLISPVFIVFFIAICGSVISKNKLYGRYFVEIIITHLSFLLKKKVVIDSQIVIPNNKDYIQINNKFIFGFRLFPSDQKSDIIENQNSNSYIFHHLIDKSKYKLHFKTNKKLFDNKLFNNIDLTFGDSYKFIQYDYYLYITVFKESDINFAKKHITTNLLINYQILNAEELLKIN